MKLATTRFGALDVADDRVLTFPDGLPGFTAKRWALIDEPSSPEVVWLQSVDEPAIALLLLDPAKLALSYAPTPRPTEIRAILPTDGASEPIAVRVVVRPGERPGELYVNLFAPLLVNFARRLAMQIPLVGSGYGVRDVWPPRPDAAKTEPQAEPSEP